MKMVIGYVYTKSKEAFDEICRIFFCITSTHQYVEAAVIQYSELLVEGCAILDLVSLYHTCNIEGKIYEIY